MEITSRVVGKIDERDVIAFSLKNNNCLQINILNFGGIVTDIIAPDREGRLENVVLSYKDINAYEENIRYLGAIIGRTSGRMCKGKVDLDDIGIEFNKNDGGNLLHGGVKGFNKRFWNTAQSMGSDKITLHLSYLSPDGEENYPGNVEVLVDYTVTNDNELIIEYRGKSDKKTLLNLTNHSYFNLSGNVRDNILNHELFIDSDYILELDDTMVPTGRLIKVDSTPFDFRKPQKIGKGIDENHPQIKVGSGYDHPWRLNPGEGAKVRLMHKESGRAMEVYTDYNYIVAYSMNFPDDNLLSTGRRANLRDAICLETQSPPIGRGQCFLEESVLEADRIYSRMARFRFYVVE